MLGRGVFKVPYVNEAGWALWVAVTRYGRRIDERVCGPLDNEQEIVDDLWLRLDAEDPEEAVA